MMSKHLLALLGSSTLAALSIACGDPGDDAESQSGTAAGSDGPITTATDDGADESSGADGSTGADGSSSGSATADATSDDATTSDVPTSSASSAEASSGSDAETSAGNAESDDGGPFECGRDVPCHRGEACVFPMGDCGDDGSLGTCIPTDDVCELSYLPVCGCDGMTYANECMALASGVDVASDGPC